MGKLSKRQTIDSQINEQEKMPMSMTETPSWSELPAPVINEIYQNLSDADKLSMSMVM